MRYSYSSDPSLVEKNGNNNNNNNNTLSSNEGSNLLVMRSTNNDNMHKYDQTWSSYFLDVVYRSLLSIGIVCVLFVSVETISTAHTAMTHHRHHHGSTYEQSTFWLFKPTNPFKRLKKDDDEDVLVTKATASAQQQQQQSNNNYNNNKNVVGRLATPDGEISFQDILTSRALLLPEQDRMPMHVLSWTSNYGFTMWTLKVVGEELNVDDRSSGAVEFLYAVGEGEFADRFRVGSGNKPLHMGWATQDYPQNPCAGSPSGCGSFPAPIFTFGTVPKDKSRVPSLAQAPTLPLAPCVAHAYDPSKYSQCVWFSSPSQCSGENMYVPTYGSDSDRVNKFNTLIPKMVWRGSDWRYLSEYVGVGTETGENFLSTHNLCSATKDTIVSTVLHSKTLVSPRLYAAIVGALHPDKYDIKFTDKNPKAPQSSCIDDKFDIFTSTEFSACDYAKYKYLVDFGGGGGTSWKSTLWFLGMPGVLFHHETPMRDSFYDDIKPYVHYIPLKADLSNLESQMQWAISNPAECAEISKRATAFVQHLMSPDGLKEHARKVFVEPFRKYIDAYDIRPADEFKSTADLTAQYSNGLLETVKYSPQEPAYLGTAEWRGE
jgi:hypothetical protein